MNKRILNIFLAITIALGAQPAAWANSGWLANAMDWVKENSGKTVALAAVITGVGIYAFKSYRQLQAKQKVQKKAQELADAVKNLEAAQSEATTQYDVVVKELQARQSREAAKRQEDARKRRMQLVEQNRQAQKQKEVISQDSPFPLEQVQPMFKALQATWSDAVNGMKKANNVQSQKYVYELGQIITKQAWSDCGKRKNSINLMALQSMMAYVRKIMKVNEQRFLSSSPTRELFCQNVSSLIEELAISWKQ